MSKRWHLENSRLIRTGCLPSCYETLIHIYQLRNRECIFQRIKENISSLLKEEWVQVSDDQQV